MLLVGNLKNSFNDKSSVSLFSYETATDIVQIQSCLGPSVPFLGNNIFKNFKASPAAIWTIVYCNSSYIVILD